MVIQVQRQQRTDVHPEDQIFVHVLRQHQRIQPVEPLHDHHRVRVQPQGVAPPLPPSGEEIEGGKAYLLPVQQAVDVLAEQVGVQGVDVFQIQLAVRPRGDFVPVNVVVVQAHENGLFPVNTELGGQPVGGGGLSRGAGPCQHHHSGPPAAHLIGDLGISLFMEGFVHPD